MKTYFPPGSNHGLTIFVLLLLAGVTFACVASTVAPLP